MNPEAGDGGEPLEVIDLEPATAVTTRTERERRSRVPRRRGPVVLAIIVVVALVVSVVASRAHDHGTNAASPSTSDASKAVIHLRGGGLFPFRAGARVLTAGDDGLRIVDTDTGSIGVPTIAGLPAGPATVVASSGGTVAVRVDFELYWFTLTEGIAHRIEADTAFAAADPGYVWLANDHAATEVPGGPNRLHRARIDTTGRAIGATRRGLLERVGTGYAIQPIDGTSATRPFLPSGARVIGVHSERVAWVDPACDALRCSVHITEVSSNATTSWLQLRDHPIATALVDTTASFQRDGRRLAIVVPDDTIPNATSTVVADLRTKTTTETSTTGYITAPAAPGSDDRAGATIAWTADDSYLLLAPAAGTGAGRFAVIDPGTGTITSARVPLDVGSSAAVIGDSTLGPSRPIRSGSTDAIARDAVPSPRAGVQLVAADESGVSILDLATNRVRSFDLAGLESSTMDAHSIARVQGGWLVVRGDVVDFIGDAATSARVAGEGTQVYSANGGRSAWIASSSSSSPTFGVESYDPATNALGPRFQVDDVVGASDLGLVAIQAQGDGVQVVLVDAAGNRSNGPFLAHGAINVLAVAGTSLIYSDTGGGHLLDLTTGRSRLLASDWDDDAALSPDGSFVVWHEIGEVDERVVAMRVGDAAPLTLGTTADRVLVADDGTVLAIHGRMVFEGLADGRGLQPYDGLSPDPDAALALG